MKATDHPAYHRKPATFELRDPDDGFSSAQGERDLVIHRGESGHAHRLTIPELADLRRLLAAEVDEHTGRKLNVRVYGDSPGEMEHAARLAAQDFFGPDVPTDVAPRWIAELVVQVRELVKADGRKYVADMTVRELAQAPEGVCEGCGRASGHAPGCSWIAQFTP
jgi:hypothetical protein